MKVVCSCGHNVTMTIPPEKERFWTEHAKLCECVDCYVKRTGYHAGANAAMLREIKYEVVK